MRCHYELKVRARCPVEPSREDAYDFIIESESMIEVEKINAFMEKNAWDKEVFQEVLTENCADHLRAQVTSIGWHSGIKVTCIAP